jgi:hypothetical protein
VFFLKLYNIRIDEELFAKLEFLAVLNNRSINKQIIHLIATNVNDYEKVAGPIKPFIKDKGNKNNGDIRT